MAEQPSERERFEAWAVGILGDNPTWRESAPCELAWQSWQARAALSQPSTEQGWKQVPIEPQSAMLDRAVAFALNVKLSSDYKWTDYMKDLWATMLAGSPPPPIEPREEKL